MAKTDATAARLPTYLLYAEEGGMAPMDVVHCESIAQRSALHGWEIKAHRHASLMQVLLLERGRAQVSLDGENATLAGPALITVQPLAAHSFRWEPGVEGSVVTLNAAHVHGLLAGDAALSQAVLHSRAQVLDDPAHRAVALAVGALRQEHRHLQGWRARAIDAAIVTLLVAVARALPPVTTGAVASDRAVGHVTRLRSLVDRRYREHPSVAELAAELGITPTQLNRVCRQVLGHSALAVLHARLLLEAQRELTYTTLGVKQIASNTGFADPGYFTRFFHKAAGVTPTVWRRRMHAAASTEGGVPQGTLGPAQS